MKKKGFTLIELLAVIVILAIIALIATPIVMNVIENARKGAAERSAENYIDAVELAIASKRLDGPVADGEYEVMSNGNLCNGTVSGTTCTGTELTVEVNGDKPEAGGKIKVVNGQVVTSSETKMTIGDYTASYNTEGKIEATKGKVVYSFPEETVSMGAKLSTFEFVENPATLDKEVYLKYDVDADNQVSAAYACAILDGKEICLQGGKDKNGNTYYNQNKEFSEKIDNGSGLCQFDTTDFFCQEYSDFLEANIHIYASQTDGSVYSNIDLMYVCRVNDDGSSICYDNN